ncbi:MAG: phospho-N-acetylmuramoyl-pentapeptide-transferase [Alphaproteobacteria bacterium]|nr:phospho-N-acetylmuramoyl-pentapeptide-transferase [Alphaproteobacteria bacterium]
MLISRFGLDADIILRAFMALLTALGLSLLFGSGVIALLRKHQHHGQPIRTDGPQSHLKTKQGTPTMGGLMILGTSMIAIALFANISYHFVWVSLLVMFIYGLTGFIDDYIKVTKETPNALTAKAKLFLQFMTAVVVATIITAATPQAYSNSVYIPYFRAALYVSWLYIPFAVVVISGASNGVNLSDGLDGLASGLLVIAFTFFAIMAYIVGTPLAKGFALPYIPRSAEMAVVCAAVVGACLGFLRFNAPKAKVFMGDTGSLALGALLGTVAVILKQEILLAIAGVVFVLETVSVMIQVIYYRKTGKRFFKMAPIHHHFEQCGWSEQKVVLRFWLVGFIAAFVAMLSLIKF